MAAEDNDGFSSLERSSESQVPPKEETETLDFRSYHRIAQLLGSEAAALHCQGQILVRNFVAARRTPSAGSSRYRTTASAQLSEPFEQLVMAGLGRLNTTPNAANAFEASAPGFAQLDALGFVTLCWYGRSVSCRVNGMHVRGAPKHGTRRKFLRDCGQVALGLSSSSLLGYSRYDGPSAQKEAVASAASSDWHTLTSDLETRLPALLAQAPTVPAVSMALVADAQLLWRGAFGVKDLESKTPVDHDTIFEVGSVSKTVFAYVVMKLCEKGVLDLDTPLTRYTPDRLIRGDPRLELITARRVLSHTTGLQNWRSAKEPLAIRFTPGERWSYSGEGYSYLQSVVTHLVGHVNLSDCKTVGGARVCATDFDAYMRANLLAPFGMTSSGYLYREGMARPHDDRGKLIADRKSTPIEAARYGAAGGLQTTPTEYARFLIEVINPKPSDEYRLSASSLREMVRPQIKLSESLSWALGWEIQHTQAGDVISHGGENPGYQALVAASMRRKAGFIILTNGDRGYDEIIKKVATSEELQRFLPTILG